MATSLKRPQRLHRYTSLPALLHLLRHQRLTLLSPDKWEDKNDVYYMDAYKKLLNYSCVLAVCFAEGSETFHHWRVFTSGSDGIRIEFDREELLTCLKRSDGLKFQKVRYRLVKDLKEKPPRPRDLPFVKRYPFKDEAEFRIVYSSKLPAESELKAKDFAIDLSAIRRITLSPWLPRPLTKTVKATIGEITGCGHVEITQSQLVEYRQWTSFADDLERRGFTSTI